MFDEYLNIDAAIKNRIVQTVLIILVLWVINKLAIRLFTHGTVEEIRKQYHWRKTIEYSLFTIGALVLGNLWISNFQFIVTFLGILSAGIAIALKEVFMNIAGWAFIYIRKPFDVGDRIQIGDVKGDVIDLRLFQFTLLEIGNWVDADQSTGRVIHVPNLKVFIEPQANYSQGFNYIWNEQLIYITLDSDYKRAKTLLIGILNSLLLDEIALAEAEFRRARDKHLIVYNQFTPAVFIDITERGVQIAMRYLCNPRKRRMIQHAITESVLESFGPEENIQLAYPTTTVHFNNNPNRDNKAL
ncbi:MAG TPA: mechanosensitive ion channel domain-containing protein [Cyclobacteriaceae bacterium]|nr:mechanosensitive ion channel domain-containing protein [Cyclobacteriaceae bacterium]